MRKSLILLSLIFGITKLSSILFCLEPQLHPFVNEKKYCNVCHVIYQITGTPASYILIRADSTLHPTDVCLECHQQKPTDHPIHVVASFSIPKDLPLSMSREITCVTCHNPHFPRFSNRPWQPRSLIQKLDDFIKRKKQFKTYFLRRNNSQGELCLSCHKRVRPFGIR